MKKILLIGACCVMACDAAMAGVKYTETETVTIVERFYTDPVEPVRFASSRDVAKKSKPCAHQAAPVRVKTHSEVIDYYQVYQPVTIYKPAGVEVQRRVVPVKNCNKCGM